jgi:hypothetical protein
MTVLTISNIDVKKLILKVVEVGELAYGPNGTLFGCLHGTKLDQTLKWTRAANTQQKVADRQQTLGRVCTWIIQRAVAYRQHHFLQKL